MTGRRRKPKSELRNETVVLRVSTEEKRQFVAAARRAGSGGVSAWIRMLAIRFARKGPFPGGSGSSSL